MGNCVGFKLCSRRPVVPLIRVLGVMAQDSGLNVKQYRYYNKSTVGLDFTGMMEDITVMPTGSVVLLHACAHNPTGIDLNDEQWKVS